MAWQDSLVQLKKELAKARAEQMLEAAEFEAEHQRQLQQLSDMGSALGIQALLDEMNEVLLDGKGQLDIFAPGHPPEGETEGDLDDMNLEDDVLDDEEDLFTAILSWEEAGEREIAVDLGLAGGEMYLRVNGADLRTEKGALEEALLNAFREELEL